MTLQELPYDFTVCKIGSVAATDALARDFSFLSKTDKEISLTCPTSFVPEDVLAREDGWQGFRITGNLDFSLVGVLSKISSLLATNGIPIYVVSTFDTDYVFVKKERYKEAKEVLQKGGYAFL